MNTINPINVNSNTNLNNNQRPFLRTSTVNIQDSYIPSFKAKVTNKNVLLGLITSISSLFATLKIFKPKAKISERERIIKEALDKFPNGIENATPQEIFEQFGIQYKQDDNGMFTLSHYNPVLYNEHNTKEPHMEKLTFSDLGIDENKLLENVKEIKGEANLVYSNATEMNNIEKIGGDLVCTWNVGHKSNSLTQLQSKITSLPKLKTVGGNVFAMNSKIKEFELEAIDGALFLKGSQDVKLSKLQSIGGLLNAEHSKNIDLSNLKTINSQADISFSENIQLNDLKHTEGTIWLREAKNINMGRLKTIGKYANIICINAKDIKLNNLSEEIKNEHIVIKNSEVDFKPLNNF